MALSAPQIQELIKNPRNRVQVENAVKHQERISFHGQAVDNYKLANAYYKVFLDWVENGIKLPADKFAVFKNMLRFPVSTTSLISSIFDEFTTIFSAQDSYREYNFSNPEFTTEFDTYLEDINLQTYISETIFQAFKERHNSLLVIDLPQIQVTERPQPYFYEVPIDKVHDINVIEKGGEEIIEYVIFSTGKDELAAFDDEFYRVFRKDNSGDYMLQTEVVHNIGITPANFISSYPLSGVDHITRKSPLSESASDLDWLLFLKTAKRQYEIYGAFPIISTYENECDFTDGGGSKCNNGYIAGVDSVGAMYSYQCPACEKNSLVGPGSVISVPVPRSKDEPDLRNPVTITPPDIDSLKNLSEEVDRIEWDIFTNVVGGVDGVLNKQAINEIQASAIVESKRKKYIFISTNFEKVEKFITDVFAAVMFPGFYEGCTINYGQQFDLYTSENVLNQLGELRKVQMPQYIIDQKVKLFIQSDNRNNYAEQQRLELLKLLEPYPNMSIQDVLALGLKDVDENKFLLKANFANFVSEFELNNGDIVSWGNLLNFDVKMAKLKQALEEYGTSIWKSRQEPRAPDNEGQAK